MQREILIVLGPTAMASLLTGTVLISQCIAAVNRMGVGALSEFSLNLIVALVLINHAVNDARSWFPDGVYRRRLFWWKMTGDRQ
ncbi:hypothetical protein LPW26_05975 [Rhodopseudomonas sp. HC1]|uniref:hypothetical protein n=1 Tax=Rhodopseudomonas infernalis TaxID=2897386 RepID=UPI001EE8FE56|nr:hypothetical protein [Rhodopseudomonas infernalis]MCG6204174.1 hypothetical protein [Rhodopseudomonas infernalis]